MGEVECFVCKAQGKKQFTFSVDNGKVGQIINCPFCQCQFLLIDRAGKLRLDYPKIAEEETADSANLDNISNIGVGGRT